MIVCPYCEDEFDDEDVDIIDVEKCSYKPFTVVLTRAEIWGLVDDYHMTKKAVIKKLKKVIGRNDF